jgi:hypothetical protein
MENVKLDKEKLKLLLANSDIKWFESHDSGYDYRDHLDFTAGYIAQNYNRTRGDGSPRSKDRAAKPERQAKPRRDTCKLL